jgi:hypothetical protein
LCTRIEDETDKLKELNGALCTEVNAKDGRIRELESLVRDMYSMRECFRPNDKWPWIEKRIRELGMEADG